MYIFDTNAVIYYVDGENAKEKIVIDKKYYENHDAKKTRTGDQTRI